jgi:exopolysaccharide production protein ExoZ
MQTQRFPQLQALRGFAAALVVVDHSIAASWPENLNTKYLGWCCGDLGVGIFFVISGFIMVHVSEPEFGRPGAAWRFIARRLERIVPLYWLATALSAVLLFLHRGVSIGFGAKVSMIVMSALFIPYRGLDGLYRPVHDVGWTLNYEMLFYALFAASLFCSSRRAALTVSMGALALLFLSGAASEGADWTYDAQSLWAFVSYPIIGLFLVGMLLRVVVGVARPVRSIANSAAIMSLVPLLVVAIFGLEIRTYPVSAGWRLFAWTTCAVCVCGAVWLEKARSSSRARFFERLGDASYSTYLFHPFVLSLMPFLASRVWLGGWALFLMCLILAHLCGLFVHATLERPLLLRFSAARHPVKTSFTSAETLG